MHLLEWPIYFILCQDDSIIQCFTTNRHHLSPQPNVGPSTAITGAACSRTHDRPLRCPASVIRRPHPLRPTRRHRILRSLRPGSTEARRVWGLEPSCQFGGPDTRGEMQEMGYRILPPTNMEVEKHISCCFSSGKSWNIVFQEARTSTSMRTLEGEGVYLQ